ncbi:molybdopterin molybdotransferase MoeA [Pelagibius litoralis]|uniref:Molybdopterin molybdenumtransferase n=1 Tax=Pelagibius litoralis TaxID=374515 RepID=A0A967C6M4_9PROT|nr:gephyrin-like molybdotransferase Glp [Pelagibius litoralis]NIA67312.1 molybdopterin molybdotransferase MoeA [Pelagibius litoralis]
MISVEEALTRILERFRPLPSETLGLGEAFGRVLATDIAARVTQPPKAVSAMDGYAVRAADVAAVPASLKVIGRVPAGSLFAGQLGPGEAVRIFTGAPLPDGADAIVIQEDTEVSGDQVTVKESSPLGHYVRPAGLDFSEGDAGPRAGQRLTARDVGLIAAMNHPWVQVHRRPRVAILATGDEVVMPGDPLGPSQIVSSNGLALAAFVRACGGDPIQLGIAPDRSERLAELAAGARGADLLLTAGGASVGEHDLVQSALEGQGLQLDFWKIAMRPGKPLMFGQLGDTPMLGLPGNPVSALVCALLFARPALNRLRGLDSPAHPVSPMRLGADLPANDRRQDYLRARVSKDSQGQRTATAYGRQDSSMLAMLAAADGLILRPPHAEAARSGAMVPVMDLRELAEGL